MQTLHLVWGITEKQRQSFITYISICIPFSTYTWYFLQLLDEHKSVTFFKLLIYSKTMFIT